jgi:uncharacterized protein with NAD-binding domain and iron-sulfur cluster
MSTRTGGYMLLQLLFDLARPGAQADRVLNGPTNVVWIEPWLAHLQKLGVVYRTGAKVQDIHCEGGRITGVTVQFANGTSQCVEADYYVAALPVEVLQGLLTEELMQADPALAKLHDGWQKGKLRTAWMNGILFYLAQDVPLVRGHTLYIDSEWSLTSVSQQQFWPEFRLEECGDGRVRGVLSVDISDWEKPGGHGIPPAKQLTDPIRIKEEVWEQLKNHLNDGLVPVLEDANLATWFLDSDIVYPNPPGVPVNLEPLLINTTGSLDYRPNAVTRIANFFLAGDYVRTHTDLATMEAANESARRAVNGILRAARSRARRCKIWPLREPFIFAPLRAMDRWRFHHGLPHNPSLIRFALVFFVPLWHMLYLAWKVFRVFQGLLGWSEPLPPPHVTRQSQARVKQPSALDSRPAGASSRRRPDR